MKKFLLPALLAVSMPFFNSCTSDNEELAGTQEQPTDSFAPIVKDFEFPAEETSTLLPEGEEAALAELVSNADPSIALQLGETDCTEEEFEEIKAFVDEELRGETGEETYLNIFKWLTKNVKYASPEEIAYLRPYDVFRYKKCVCQGYANLHKVMMLTQELPAFIANGWLATLGGHAWNYVYDGEKWWVSDATNGNKYLMSNVGEYTDRLIPHRADVTFFEDDIYTYGFKNHELNINMVKSTAPEEICLPRSVGGYTVTCFDPEFALPMHVKVLGLPKNISTLSQYTSTLQEYTPGLEEIHVEDGHPALESYKGIVYLKDKKDPYFFPAKIKVVELKMKMTMGKNAIYDLPEVEEIIIPEGVKKIEDYAIENCPKLKIVRIPESVKTIGEQFIYRCPADVQVLRVPTGIYQVPM